MNFELLQTAPRLLAEIKLSPVQGSRFQPTGFPDLGAAEYSDPKGVRMLLVESAQSMANRLEEVCWDEATSDLVKPLRGLPYVVSHVGDDIITNSILEAHRLNSPYIVKTHEFADTIAADIGFEKSKPFNRRKLAKALFKYDPNSLIHGIFLEKIGGTVRLPRALSAFVEASHIAVAPSGGVKFDRIQPASTGDSTAFGKAAEGFGNVPYHRDEYTGEITAYFNLDLALIRGLGLGRHAQRLLIGLSLFKIARVLQDGLRLRTACDLQPTDGQSLKVTAPAGFSFPSLNALEEAMPVLIGEAKPAFAQPVKTELKYKG